MVLTLQILGCVAALALGIWLGLPGRYERRDEEIDRAMGAPGGRTKKVKRHFTPLAWVRRQIDVSSGGSRSRGSGGGGGRGFRLERPDRDRTAPSSGQGGGGAFKLRRPGEERGTPPDPRPPARREPEAGRPSEPEPETPADRDERLRGRFRLRHPDEGSR